MKFFTPESANQTLPLVKRIVDDILRVGRQIRSESMEIEKPEESPEINRLMDQLDELFDELEAIGCSYRDWNFSEGLVDFPAKMNDREVLLCWRSDESDVRFYHEIDAGFAGRKPIPKEVLEK